MQLLRLCSPRDPTITLLIGKRHSLMKVEILPGFLISDSALFVSMTIGKMCRQISSAYFRRIPAKTLSRWPTES